MTFIKIQQKQLPELNALVSVSYTHKKAFSGFNPERLFLTDI